MGRMGYALAMRCDAMRCDAMRCDASGQLRSFPAIIPQKPAMPLYALLSWYLSILVEKLNI